MASTRDYYEVLGVPRDATPEQIKKAYKKLALANHPDRNPGNAEATERFKEAAEAFEVLNDTRKRARYDQYGHAGVQGNGGGAGFHDVNDIFEAFGGMFGDLFGGGQSSRGRTRRGDHLQVSVTIDLLEAANGCTREIEFSRNEVCDECDGSGAKPGTAPENCDYCGGHGQVVQSQGFFRVQTTCPACRGKGTTIRDKCGTCRGTGREKKKHKQNVRIPAGVDTGNQLCIRGEGEPGIGPNGQAGGPRGDLYVDIRVKKHPLFEREGTELFVNIPITYTQAVLGANIEVPQLEGRHDLNIPAGTQSGEIFRLRGQGLPDPHGGRKGDLHVVVALEVPKKVDSEQEELLRKLAEHEKINVSPHRKSFFETLKDYFTDD